MGTIKDRNGKDQTEAEEKNKRQAYTEEPYKKELNDSCNHDGVVTYLKPDILECGQVGLRKHYNKSRRGDGISAELFKILKDDAVKMLHSVQFISVHSVMSDSLRPHGLQHNRPPCPPPTPGVYSNSCPFSW